MKNIFLWLNLQRTLDNTMSELWSCDETTVKKGHYFVAMTNKRSPVF